MEHIPDRFARSSASGGGHTPDGKKLYVANGRSGTVSVIDTTLDKRVSNFNVEELPWGVATH